MLMLLVQMMQLLKLIDAKLYVPVVTLSAEDNVKLVKQLNEGFKRPVYWNKYKITDNKVVELLLVNEEKHIRLIRLSRR